MHEKDKDLAFLFLVIAIFSISTAAIFIRFAQKTIPSITIAAYRLVIASLIMLPFTFRKAACELSALKIRSLIMVIISGLLLACHFASWIISLELTNVISSVILVTTTPIWVAALSPLIFKVNISKRFWLGLMIAFIGIILVSLNSSDKPINRKLISSLINENMNYKGNLLALMGAFYAAGYVIIGKILRKDLSTTSYTIGVYTTAAILLCIYAFLFKKESMYFGFEGFKWLVLIALIPQVIGHSLINWSLGKLPAHLVSLSLLGESAGSTIMAIIFLQEYPSTYAIIGGLIILLGINAAIPAQEKIEAAE